ncbi:MAG: hypothetical protein R2828_33865 [Saprospiraceae bacterium]
MMSNNVKTILTIVGFLLAGTGILALILNLVGLKLAILVWMDGFGKLFGLVMQIVMSLAGFIMIYVGQTDLSKEEA